MPLDTPSSPTPRTDGVLPNQSFIDETRLFDRCYYLPLIEHARSLERELDKREKQLIETQQQLIQRNADLALAQSETAPSKKLIKWAVQMIEGKYRVFETSVDGKNLARLRSYANE